MYFPYEIPNPPYFNTAAYLPYLLETFQSETLLHFLVVEHLSPANILPNLLIVF